MAIGEEDSDFVFGAIYIHFPAKNDICVIYPVYWVPNEKSNTLSPGALE